MWTIDRPTKPGKYWLCIHPDQRGILCEAGVYDVEIRERGHVYHMGGMTRFTEDRLVGAQWLPFEPADPFAEPVPIEMYRMSDDAKTPNLRLILSVEPGEVVLYEADMTSRSATAKETTVHDKIIMSPADARWLRDALEQADLSDPPEVTR